jgi:hypothetical protein
LALPRDMLDHLTRLSQPGLQPFSSNLTESEKDATSGDQQASDTISDSDFSRGG